MNITSPPERCPICGGDHEPHAHYRADAARRAALVAELEGAAEARIWKRHALLLDAGARLRAVGYSARAVYELNATLRRAA